MRIWKVSHLAYLGKAKVYAVVPLAKRFAAGIVFGVLAAEFVGGKAEDNQTLVGVLLVERLQAFQLRGEAALGRAVEDEDNFAFEVGKIDRARRLFGFERVEFGHCVQLGGCGG